MGFSYRLSCSLAPLPLPVQPPHAGSSLFPQLLYGALTPPTPASETTDTSMPTCLLTHSEPSMFPEMTLHLGATA